MGDVVSSILFQPPTKIRLLKESKVTWLNTKNGYRIPSVYIPYTNQNDSTGLTILYSHANAEDLADVYVWLKYLAKFLKCNVIGYDYTGYGQSEGLPAEEHCYADIDAVYEHLVDVKRCDPSKIVLFGRSLGSGPSCYLASRTNLEGRPVAGLILHSPFMSVYRVVLDVGCTLAGDKFPNIDFAPDIQNSVLLLHGTNDNIIPHKHSDSLSKAFGTPKEKQLSPVFLDGMGHNSLPNEHRPMFMSKIQLYLKDYLNVEATKSSRNLKLPRRERTPEMSPIRQAYLEERIFNVYVKSIQENCVEVHM